MNKQFLITVFVGVLLIGAAVYFVFSSTKESHLELKGQILKVRTGEIDENDSVAMVDFRVENPSNIPFVVRDVDAKLERPDGKLVDGNLVARGDMNQLLEYNKLLGAQYNDTLTIHDKISPHTTADRMVAVSFPVPYRDLENSKAIHLEIQDVDGALFQTSHPIR